MFSVGFVLRYEPPSDEQKVKARAIVAKYVLSGDMAKALTDLLDLEVVQSHLRPKTLQQKKDFRDHVSRAQKAAGQLNV